MVLKNLELACCRHVRDLLAVAAWGEIDRAHAHDHGIENQNINGITPIQIRNNFYSSLNNFIYYAQWKAKGLEKSPETKCV
jgi:hypothetical protein